MVESHVAELVNVQQRLAAGTVTAGALRGEIAACIGASSSAIHQAKASASSDRAERVGLDAARNSARAAVDDFADAFYRDRIFDPYLKFASAEEEAAYRRREEERRVAIETAKAEGTPEGDLRALRLSQAQLQDAGAHGATASPDYQHWADRFDRAEAALEAEVVRGKKSAATAAPAADPLDEIAPSGNADPAVLAALRSTGVVVADQSRSGHGVTLNVVTGQQTGIV